MDIVYIYEDNKLKLESSTLFKSNDDAYESLLKNILNNKNIIIDNQELEKDAKKFMNQFPKIFEELKKINSGLEYNRIRNYYSSYNTFKAYKEVDNLNDLKTFLILSFFTQDELMSLCITGELTNITFLEKLSNDDKKKFSKELFTTIKDGLQDDFLKFKEYALSLKVSEYLQFLQEDLKNA